MQDGSAKQLRSLLTQARQLTSGDDRGRYLDLGIVLRVVRQDVEKGTPPIPGRPPVVWIRDHHFGGVYDRASRRFIAPSPDPIVWFAGEKQAAILLDPMDERTRVLLYAAEGAGKSHTGAQWLILRALHHAAMGTAGSLGATAPTNRRLKSLTKHICSLVPIDSSRSHQPNAWGRHYLADNVIVFDFGIEINLCATKRASEAIGSPIQSFTWLDSLDDELQDTAENGADPDIEARLRGSAKSRRMCTATAKDSPIWRTFRDGKLASPNWRIERIPYTAAEFIWPKHWQTLKEECSEREWKRRGLAEDVPPENAVYPSWSREQNLVPVPDVYRGRRVRDITGEVLGETPRGDRYAMLLGHDPGESCDVTLFLRCYEMHEGRDVYRGWWVVDEITTTGTSEAHIEKVQGHLRAEYGLQSASGDSGRVLVRCDPQGQTERRTDAEIYTMWRSYDFQIASAAYTRNNKPHGRISKRVGIDMVNTLFRNTNGRSRLHIRTLPNGEPCAPRLVQAIEFSERHPISGEAEIKYSNRPDLSHWPAALRYALWQYERPLRRFHEQHG